MSLSGIQIHAFPPQRWLSAVLKIHPHTVNGFCKSKFILRIPYSLQQTSPHLTFPHHYIRKQCSKLSSSYGICFIIKHRAKPTFLHFWSKYNMNALPSLSASSELDSILVSTILVCRYTVTGSMFSILTLPVRHHQLSFKMELIHRGLWSDCPLLFSVLFF